MADAQQAIYEEYVRVYGKPKQAKHLVAYSKKQGKILKFSDAKRLLLNNMNRDKDTKNKATSKAQPKSKTQAKSKPPAKPKENKDSKVAPHNVNGTKKVLKQSKPKKGQKSNMSSITSALFGGLSGAIKPLSSIKPIEVSQKMDQKEIEKLSNGSSKTKEDVKNEKKYKTIKKKKLPKSAPKSPKKTNNKYKKQKGTGTTPKPIAIATKSKQKKGKKEKKDEPKLRRKLTPIPPPKGKDSVLSLASKFEKEGNKKKDKARKSKRMSAKRNSTKKVNKKRSNHHNKKNNAVKEKWDKEKEIEVTKWFNLKMETEILKINGGKKYLRNILENGQLLCRLVNKLSPQMIDPKIIKQKPNIIRYDVERIETFLSCCKKLGISDDNLLFAQNAMRSNTENMMSVLRTLCELKKEITEREKQSPLNLWCSYNEIADDILDSLEKAHYDLQKLFSLKSDEIEKTLSNELTLSNKLKLMKCIVKLKQENVDCDEWILLKEDIYCNLVTKKILNLNNKRDAQQLMAPFLLISGKNHMFLLLLFEKYFEQQWFVEGILGFISRLNVKHNKKYIRQHLSEIFSKKLSPIAVRDVSDFDVAPDNMRATKLSYNLMELLTACASSDNIVHSFIDSYCRELIFHSLCVFLHGESAGNAYHARIICDFLLDKFAQHLLSAICSDQVIALLLRYAVTTQLSHGNLNSFILELVSFETQSDEKLSQLKKRVIDKFISWKYIDYLVATACCHENYALFLTDLLARCAFDAESHRLFSESQYVSTGGLVHGLIEKGVLNEKLHSFHRITCCQTLCAMLDILKMPTLIVSNEENPDEEKRNYLHSTLFESSLSVVYNSYFESLCAMVLDSRNEAQIRINYTVISSPFGPLRFHCLELIGITVDLSMLNAAVPLSKIRLSFWAKFADLLFVHRNNNFFLNQFRRLIHLSMLFRRRILKYLCVNCNLLHKFATFYKSEEERTELHGFIVQMLWNFYSNDQQQEQQQQRSNFSDDAADQFDIFAHFESFPEWSAFFMPIIENEMKSRVLTQDIDLNIDPIVAQEEEEEEDDINDDDDDINLINDDIFNWNPFREEIVEQNMMPNAEYLSHFGLFRDYRFNMKFNEENNKKDPLYVWHCAAQTVDAECYLMFEWCHNMKCTQNNYNIMIVLDHSHKMSHKFKEESGGTKMSIICDILCNLLFEETLADNDRIGLISFDHEAYLDFDLTQKGDIASQQLLRECIENMRLESHECNISDAFYRAVESFDDVKQNENESNRIIFITTQEPTDLHSLLSHSESLNIATSFISVTREFNLSFQSQIFECRAANYFHLTSTNEAQSMNFTHVISPIAYDINLFVADADDESARVVENIFGGMMNDNERSYRCNSGNIQSIRTLFAHCFDDSYRYNINRNEIHLIKLKNGCSKNLKISIQFTQADNGETQSIEYRVKLPLDKPHADHLDIEKAILLTDYINLLKEWIIATPVATKTPFNLNVTEKYKGKFKRLIAELEQFENKNDSDLQRELNVCSKLANFDQQSANILRDLAQFDR